MSRDPDPPAEFSLDRIADSLERIAYVLEMEAQRIESARTLSALVRMCDLREEERA